MTTTTTTYVTARGRGQTRASGGQARGHNSGVISVQAALYGRTDTKTCSEGRPAKQLSNTKCSQQGTTGVLKKRCDGKKVCELATKVVRTSDPCYGTFKYVDTNYACFPAIHLVTCENSQAYLNCDVGQVIFLYGAHYGRSDRTTCSDQRPASQLQNVDCSGPTSKVAESCNGKNSCVVRARNSVFGDPCVGTYKYLELAYTCLCEYLFHSTEDIKTPQSVRPLPAAADAMLRLTLSCTLLLAAICLIADVSTERVVTCDDGISVQRLNCDSGVISVQAALYGRTDTKTCSEGRPAQQLSNTKCSQQGTTGVLKKRCDGKKVCELATKVVRTSDPCYGTFKYVDTNYTCFPAIHLVTCENSQAYLNCDVGQVIFLYGAHYGRSDRTTCSDQRPASQLQNVDCSGPTSKVAESCNGKNSCVVRARNSVFGDPCVGTYKYLELAYTCLCEYLFHSTEDIKTVLQ
ncbi:L-rhamnose-binding lectin CSL1-like [Centropristis striata]|uniref:L-rhamnose-binding lectin CSL1-like n=1 Tax=Centropristis striata TaxID=184440 RepID=UPI0027DF70BD|nr:L-rhamnose-binding lectin CSL1-like [Centropristis striata]